MEAVGGKTEVFPEGPWMQDRTTCIPSFSAFANELVAPLPGPLMNDTGGKESSALGFGGDFFICRYE
jgi:hypothetical protein